MTVYVFVVWVVRVVKQSIYRTQTTRTPSSSSLDTTSGQSQALACCHCWLNLAEQRTGSMRSNEQPEDLETFFSLGLSRSPQNSAFPFASGL